jgi:ribosomal protein L16 Arg81 hydroxylase
LVTLMRGIDRRQSLPREEFFARYKNGNHPVIIVDGMKDWPAMARWTPDYLDQVCGDETVQVMAGRDSDANYEIRSDNRRTTMRFREYATMVKTAGQTNDFYLVAQNEFMQTAGAKRLYDDIVVFPEYLDKRRDGFVFLWFGPCGTVTPLHHDTADIIFAQVHGRKRFTMIPATQKTCVYNSIGVFGEVDCENPDFIRHPLYRYADKFVFDLNPGEALFIPVGWWHHVRALDVSISVSFTNFFG